VTHIPRYDDEIPDAATALSNLLSRVESEVCDPAAYGFRIEDPEHPWHRDVMEARDALYKAERDRDRKRSGLDETVDWAGRVMMAATGLLAGMLLGGIVNAMMAG
jgi:hypothetical protein